MTERCVNMTPIGENTAGNVYWCPVCGAVEDEFPPIDRREIEQVSGGWPGCPGSDSYKSWHRTR